MKWGLSALFPLFIGSLDQSPTRARTWGPTQKKCTHGGHPLESPLVFKFPHVMSLHQSAPLMETKSRCALRVGSFQFDQCCCFKMVSSLQSIDLFSVPIAMLFDKLKMLHHLPMGKDCLRALFKKCTHEELRAWAKTLPWDHPIARKLDHEVHRRRMAGESHLLFFHGPGVGSLISPFFFLDS